MTRDLLVRGMVAGVIAAVLAALFARLVAEPQIDLAIAVEAALAHASPHADTMAMRAEPEVVSRATQKGIGLLTALMLYGAAIGGLFAIIFAAAVGRVGRMTPRPLALLLAAAAFVAIVLVPALVYPPTPPAVGRHDTVAFRTIAYFGLLGCSLVAMMIAYRVAQAATARFGRFDGVAAGAAAYAVAMLAVRAVLPAIDEVPAAYPAVVLWNFRIASIGTQAVLWATIALSFGWMADRRLRRATSGGAVGHG